MRDLFDGKNRYVKKDPFSVYISFLYTFFSISSFYYSHFIFSIFFHYHIRRELTIYSSSFQLPMLLLQRWYLASTAGEPHP